MPCDEMRGKIAAVNAELSTILSELRGGLERLYGERLVRVMLFGSRARGDAEADADIDVLVVLRGSVRPYEEIGRVSALKAGLSLRYDCVVSCVFLDADAFAHRGGPLLRNVRREGIEV